MADTSPATSDFFGEGVPTGPERSPSTAQASLVVGQAVEKIVTGLGYSDGATPGAKPSIRDLQDLFIKWLGTTKNDTTAGRLQRQLPVAHPVFYAWVANNIQSIQGFGKFKLVSGVPANGAIANQPTPFDKFALYESYELMVVFGPRDYTMFTDAAISGGIEDIWYPRTPNLEGILNAPQTYKYTNEYYRYTDWTEAPSDNSITGRQGQMQFWAPGLTAAPNNVNHAPFSDMPRQYVPDGIVKMIWYQVPYRYVTSPRSFLKRFRGLINQQVFPPDSAMPVWLPGELLYLSYNAKKYTRPPADDANTSVSPYMGNFSFNTYDKLCDIELTFLSTRRVYPNPNETAPEPLLSNYVVQGHNLMPATSITRLYHYAQTAPNDPLNNNLPNVENGRPFWYSCPMHLLFMDPDYEQPVGNYSFENGYRHLRL